MLTTNTEISRPAQEATLEELWATSQQSARDHAAYVIARAIRYETNVLRREGDEAPRSWLLRRLMRAFTPITNENKLRNGQKPYGSLQECLYLLHIGPMSLTGFQSKLPEGMRVRLRHLAEQALMDLRAELKK